MQAAVKTASVQTSGTSSEGRKWTEEMKDKVSLQSCAREKAANFAGGCSEGHEFVQGSVNQGYVFSP